MGYRICNLILSIGNISGERKVKKENCITYAERNTYDCPMMLWMFKRYVVCVRLLNTVIKSVTGIRVQFRTLKPPRNDIAFNSM